ncbi:MAG: hypothetical protein JWR26_2987 [Pedosphaera sp.]|nr:hypothetical protein [Pedosphaera sp.]
MGAVRAKILLPILLMIVFAATRWPGLLPWNFSAAYALMFCAGVYFPKRLVWWLPFTTMFVTDVLLNLYWKAPILGPEMIGNYLAYAGLVLLGRWFSPKSSWVGLLSGGLLGAILFYLISNTTSWLFNPFHNPEYTKTLQGWITALSSGTAGWPQTWEFFRNTLLSGGLFTGLFAGAMKLSEAAEPEEKEEEQPEEQPEEAKA